jgi:hypothetical protein
MFAHDMAAPGTQARSRVDAWLFLSHTRRTQIAAAAIKPTRTKRVLYFILLSHCTRTWLGDYFEITRAVPPQHTLCPFSCWGVALRFLRPAAAPTPPPKRAPRLTLACLTFILGSFLYSNALRSFGIPATLSPTM